MAIKHNGFPLPKQKTTSKNNGIKNKNKKSYKTRKA